MSAIVSKKPIRQVKEVRELLVNEQARDQLAAVAARHMKPERMMRVVANAIRTTPKLQQCEPMSFLGALMQCASLGLEPNTVMGHAYLIPFDNRRKNTTEVQLIVGYKGLIDLARRSGHITSLSANIHYKDDDMWEYEEGTKAQLRHIPGPQDGKKLHAYAIAQFKDGGHAYVVLPWSHVIKIRDGSQGWQTAKRFNKTAESPWSKHEDEMAKKTAIRALAKYLPLSVEFMDAMSVDDTRADYGAFALNPDQGVPAAEEDGYIDGDAEPADQAAPDPAPKKEAAAAPESKPDQKRTTAKPQENKAEKPAEADKGTAQSKPDQETGDGQLPLGGGEQAKGNDIDVERFEALAQMIIDELEDASPDEVEQMYGVQIEQMQATDGLQGLAKLVTDAIAAKRT